MIGETVRHVRQQADLSRAADGTPLRCLGTTQDITERKQVEEELRRSNAELEQFSYAISHDLRQPLRMVASYMQLLGISLAEQLDDEQREHFKFAIDGARRLDQMLVALLEYSRVGRLGEPPAWLETRAIVDEALLFLQPAIAEAQAKIRVRGHWPRAWVRPDEILRLLQNLIANAAKFRLAGRCPEIRVVSRVARGQWCLSVADNGVGIHPGQLGRLFQVFQRLQSRANYEGSGVGLALCRKIAEHHGGRIWAESAGDGQGSRFCVSLPLTGFLSDGRRVAREPVGQSRAVDRLNRNIDD
ncbi:MAG: ATPase [Candidatus Accumulibacter phosphatis]|uniref:histidine kinase n=1 Tax=Candidatus Accumulibacter phosphatis TaxID=327160 RepID=A0A6A7RQ29_9PROT|nr:ATPase [Candidatus Accumulibacter phosphatis]